MPKETIHACMWVFFLTGLFLFRKNVLYSRFGTPMLCLTGIAMVATMLEIIVALLNFLGYILTMGVIPLLEANGKIFRLETPYYVRFAVAQLYFWISLLVFFIVRRENNRSAL